MTIRSALQNTAIGVRFVTRLEVAETRGSVAVIQGPALAGTWFTIVGRAQTTGASAAGLDTRGCATSGTHGASGRAETKELLVPRLRHRLLSHGTPTRS